MMRFKPKKKQLKLLEEMIKACVTKEDTWYHFSSWVCKHRDGYYYFDASCFTENPLVNISMEPWTSGTEVPKAWLTKSNTKENKK